MEKIAKIIIETAKQTIRYTEGYIIKGMAEEKEARLWESTYDNIKGMIYALMNINDYEIEDYPIRVLYKLLEIVDEKIGS